jgi:hypothetical protein
MFNRRVIDEQQTLKALENRAVQRSNASGLPVASSSGTATLSPQLGGGTTFDADDNTIRAFLLGADPLGDASALLSVQGIARSYFVANELIYDPLEEGISVSLGDELNGMFAAIKVAVNLLLAQNGGGGSTGGTTVTSGVRTVQITSSSLLPNARDTSKTLTGGGALVALQSDAPVLLRIYPTPEDLAADAARGFAQDPQPGVSLAAEIRLNDTVPFSIAPGILLGAAWNGGHIPLAIINSGTTTKTITLSFSLE